MLTHKSSVSADQVSVMLVGDSIAGQYAPYLTAYLPPGIRLLPREGTEEAEKDPDVPRGANGGESPRLLQSLREAFRNPHLRPDISLVNCGLHDIKREWDSGKIVIESEEYRKNLELILAEFSNRKLPLVWVRTTGVVDEIHNSKPKPFRRYGADAVAYDLIAMEVMDKHGIPVIDLAAVSDNYNHGSFVDHVHFVESIRKQQAAMISGWLQGRFSQQQTP